MKRHAPFALALLALLSFAPVSPAHASHGSTRPELSWLQRGINKTVQRKGYGKLRVRSTGDVRVVLGKMSKPNKGIKKPKWESAGGVVVDPQARKVLLVRIRKEARGGRSGWTWPKGRVEAGEQSNMAAIRETFEESGVQAEPLAKIAQLRSKKALRHYYLMNKLASAGTFNPKETREVRWVSLKTAGKLLDRERDRKVLAAATTAMRELEAAAALP